MPMIMTRVWQHAFIQLPTAIYMIRGFNNSVRTIFLDGRDISDPDIVVPSYNGEIIGHWEGDTLVSTRVFRDPTITRSTPAFRYRTSSRSSSGSRMLERDKMRIEYIMTDPDMWEGEWRSAKEFDRADYTDINEATASCNTTRICRAPNWAARRRRRGGRPNSKEAKMEIRPWALAGAAAMLTATPALAHHSFAMFDQKKVMTLEGTVTEFQWTNPHAFIEMDASGQHWSIELNSPNNLKRQGWSAPR